MRSRYLAAPRLYSGRRRGGIPDWYSRLLLDSETSHMDGLRAPTGGSEDADESLWDQQAVPGTRLLVPISTCEQLGSLPE